SGLNVPVLSLEGLGTVVILIPAVGQQHEGVVVGLDKQTDIAEVIQIQIIGLLGVSVGHIPQIAGLIGVANVRLDIVGTIAGDGLGLAVDALLVDGLGNHLSNVHVVLAVDQGVDDHV